MKRCTGCKAEKPLTEFSKNRRRADGLQTRCRDCASDYYRTNRQRIIPMIRAAGEAQVSLLREYIRQYLSAHPCVDCGEGDLVVLDFDHVRGVKVREVTEMVRRRFSLQAVKAEIEKCEVRCANCHRRKTARERGGTWRLLDPAAGA